jgi:hypothetical protein
MSSIIDPQLKLYYDQLEVTFLLAFTLVVGGTFYFNRDIRRNNKQGNLNVVISIFLGLLSGTLFFFVIAVLCGAPATDKHYQTALWSALQALFCFVPLFLIYGSNFKVIHDIYILGAIRSSAQNFIYLSGLCSVFGSIVGTFFIPLDANKLWQEWPITVFGGSIIGYLFGSLLWCMNCGKIISKYNK